MAMKARYTVIDGEIIAEERNGVRREYVPDALGSTVALLDNTQTQTDTFSYWPYGEDAGRTGTTPTPFQFVGTAGYYRDSGSRAYVRARVLDKQKGRWLTQDPIGLLGGDWNLHRYANARPTKLIDSSGLVAPVIGIVVGIGIAACVARHLRDTFQLPSYSGCDRDKVQHCYMCCQITRCFVGLPVAYIAQYLWEFLGSIGGEPFSQADNQACHEGVMTAYSGLLLPNKCLRGCIQRISQAHLPRY